MEWLVLNGWAQLILMGIIDFCSDPLGSNIMQNDAYHSDRGCK
jgi:hypothetical protein